MAQYEPIGTSMAQYRPIETSMAHYEPIETSMAQYRPVETSIAPYEPRETSMAQYKPVGPSMNQYGPVWPSTSHHAHGQRLVCAAANEAGAAPAEAELTLEVLFPPSPPVIEGLESPHVRAGDTLRLVCVVQGGNPPPSLHWDKSGRPLAGPWVREGPPGVSRSHVTLTVTPEDDGAELRCSVGGVASGGGVANGGGVASTSVTLSVIYPPAEVTITGTPTVAENGTLTLTCTSAPSNPPVQLRWWLGGRELVTTDPAHTWGEGRGSVTSSNVTLVGRRQDHGRPLVCEAAGPGLGTRSTSLVLSVTHPPQALWLEAPPPNVTFRVGTRLRLSCHARGGHPPPRLAWTKDGRAVKEGPQVTGAGSVVTRELTVTVTPGDNGATYRCQAGGGAATPNRGNAPPPPSVSTRLGVLFPPLSVAITAAPPEPRPGQPLVLTCLAGPARPAPTLRWLRHGRTVPGEPLPAAPGAFGGVTAGTRLRLLVALEDQGHGVTCEATSPALGVAVSAAHRLLLRHAPQFGVGAGTLVVALEHGAAQLPLGVVAHPPVESCAWSRAGHALRPEGSPRLRLLGGGALSIANVTRGDAGTYRVRCQNAEGGASTHLRLRVHYPPAIVRAPDPVVVDEGGEGQLLCQAEGSPLPPGSLRWARLQAPGAQGLPAELTPEGGLPTGRLRVSGARRELGGPYECRVDTGVPPPARAIVRLVVRYGPELEAESGAEPVPVLVPDRSDTAQLRCRAQGVPGVQLHWEHRGHALRPDEARFQEHQWREGPWTSSLLTVANISQDRARLRHQFHYLNWDQYKKRPRYQYLNWDQSQDWDEAQNRTLGTFVCVAQNPLGTVRRRLQLQLADRPEPPRDLRVSGVTPSSLGLAWSPGFDGGQPQRFLITVTGPGAPPPPAAILAPGPTLTLGGLRPATPYDVTVRGRNARGDSEAVAIRGVTSALPQDLPPTMREEPATPPLGFAVPPALVAGLGALGGLVLLLLPAAMLGAVFWRRHFRGGASDTPPGRVKKGEEAEGGGDTPLNDYSDAPQNMEMSSTGSWVTPGDPHPWGELHPYEDVAEWGGYEEVRRRVPPPEPPVTLQGELV
ncbi:nephrin [Athene noctua]|uniref:nephrin n=1 Tax=Athene noctua TaxID=126797 RepID=UPI003EB8EDE5